MSTTTIAAIRDQIRAANDDRAKAQVALRDTETQLRDALADLNSAQLAVGRSRDLDGAGDALAALDAAERRMRALRLMKEARQAVIRDADSRLGDLQRQLDSVISTADRLRLKAAEARARAEGLKRELARLNEERERLEFSLIEAERHVALYGRKLGEITGEDADQPDETTEAATPAAA